MRKETARMVLRASGKMDREEVTAGTLIPTWGKATGERIDDLYFGKDGVVREAIRVLGGRHGGEAVRVYAEAYEGGV